MKAKPAIAIFDIGKTNKKLLLFDEDYNVLFQECRQFNEAVDEDGHPCEDVQVLTNWIRKSFLKIIGDDRFDIRAVNFSAYGASLVYVDETLTPILPLYNYLKPYPEALQRKFHSKYLGEEKLSECTASPSLGSLNSGLQLYRLKAQHPAKLKGVRYALHLPQYLSSIFTRLPYSDITSIGCHTKLWDFKARNYHHWVDQEGLRSKLAPILPGDTTFTVIKHGRPVQVGIGIHDSAAALIPYQLTFQNPFILISTGTWCISLNPFNTDPLTAAELKNDCLCYLAFDGKPVKASRLFAGNEHEQQAKRLSRFFHQPLSYFERLKYSDQSIRRAAYINQLHRSYDNETLDFKNRDLEEFMECEVAYHQLIIDIVAKQLISTNLVQRQPKPKNVYIDGGFSKNNIYMNLMAAVFPDTNIYAASVAKASALGAALAVHDRWNTKPIPSDLIQLERYCDRTMALK